MSFLSENKFLIGGIALSSAAVGFVTAWVLGRRGNSLFKLGKTHTELSPVNRYVMEYGIREPSPLRKLRQATLDRADNALLCSADEAQLMRLLMQLIKARKVIEIGVYTGYNTLSMAMMLPPDGKVVACDITDKFVKEIEGERYFKEAGVESKIDLKLQSAITTLDELSAAGEAGSFDLVFIDADKLFYDQFYEKSLQLIRKGGLIVIDNVLLGRTVCDPEKRASDKHTKAIHELNEKLHGDSRVAISFLPFSDGVTLAMKL